MVYGCLIPFQSRTSMRPCPASMWRSTRRGADPAFTDSTDAETERGERRGGLGWGSGREKGVRRPPALYRELDLPTVHHVGCLFNQRIRPVLHTVNCCTVGRFRYLTVSTLGQSRHCIPFQSHECIGSNRIIHGRPVPNNCRPTPGSNIPWVAKHCSRPVDGSHWDPKRRLEKYYPLVVGW